MTPESCMFVRHNEVFLSLYFKRIILSSPFMFQDMALLEEIEQIKLRVNYFLMHKTFLFEYLMSFEF